MDPLSHFLARFDPIDSGSAGILHSLPRKATHFAKRSDILVESVTPQTAWILVAGMAACYKVLDDGRRQVLSIMVPGDYVNLLASPFAQTGYSIQALQDCRIIEVSAANSRAINNDIGLLKVMSEVAQVEAAIARQWLIGLGRRTAEQRVAHLFCELFYRLRAIGVVEGDTFHFPLSLVDVADMIGLSTVHTCRAMQMLQKKGYSSRRRGRVVQIDIHGMSAVAAFDPAYLGPSIHKPAPHSFQPVMRNERFALLNANRPEARSLLSIRELS